MPELSETQEHDHSTDEGLWVRSDTMPDGAYGVSISVGPDRSWSLDRARAIAHAVACFELAAEVEHDAAVFGLLTGLGLSDELVGQALVNDLRPGRPDRSGSTSPLGFTAAIGRSRTTGQVVPLLLMAVDGQPAGQLTPADLSDHAAAVLKVLTVADLDARLHSALTTMFKVADQTARAIVTDLNRHWPEPTAPRRCAR